MIETIETDQYSIKVEYHEEPYSYIGEYNPVLHYHVLARNKETGHVDLGWSFKTEADMREGIAYWLEGNELGFSKFDD